MDISVPRFAWSLVGLAALLMAGCGGPEKPVDRPETVPVTGTVTYQGQPLKGATVTFHVDSSAAQGGASPSTEARGAAGSTDEAGKFTLTTFEPGDGAIPGNYRVSVTKMSGSDTPVEVNPDPTAPPPPAPKSLIPEKFSDPNQSGLTAQVTKEGENDIKLDLGS